MGEVTVELTPISYNSLHGKSLRFYCAHFTSQLFLEDPYTDLISILDAMKRLITDWYFRPSECDCNYPEFVTELKIPGRWLIDA